MVTSSKITLAVVCAILLTDFISADSVQSMVGRAQDLSSGRYLYSEQHSEIWENGRHSYSIVNYVSPDGKVLAAKKIVFSRSKTAPDYNFVDNRDGYEEQLHTLPAGEVLMKARRKSGMNFKERKLKAPEPLVVDGGFDYFVRENWATLSEGKTLYFKFAVPIQCDYYLFRVRKIGDRTIDGKAASTFRLEIASALLSLFAEAIDIDYDKANRRLLQYTGISNINNENGKSYRVRIRFEYTKTKNMKSASTVGAWKESR